MRFCMERRSCAYEGSAQKSFTMPIEVRKSWAKGALLGKPGSLSTALWQEEPPSAPHRFCASGCANHVMDCSASSRGLEEETTEIPPPPSCGDPPLGPAGFGESPRLSPPPRRVLGRAGRRTDA